MREHSTGLGELSGRQYSSRFPAVNKILYVLFTEGYLSSHAEIAIRRELCDEAIRLATILAEHPVGQVPETYALLALMHLHVARMTARQDGSNGLLLLEEQDRALWDRQRIQLALEWLAKSAGAIPSPATTRKPGLLRNTASLPRLRRLAGTEWKGPAAGLDVLKGFEPPTWLAGSYLWAAVLADLHRRCGNADAAKRYRDEALNLAPTLAVKELLQRRLESRSSG